MGDRRPDVSGGGVVALCNLLRHVEKSMGNRSMNEPNVTRRSFLRAPAAAAALAGVAPFLLSAQSPHGAGLAGAAIPQAGGARDDVVIERDLPSKPNAGKVLAAIQPHADDIPLFAGGLVAKLIREGYTGYLIRTTIDDAAGPGVGAESVIANYRDNLEVARALGLKKAYDLNYRNHQMDGVERLRRARWWWWWWRPWTFLKRGLSRSRAATAR